MSELQLSLIHIFYSHARELGCNKIALGHHFDDVIETILMGILYGGQINTMMPKLHSTNFEGMELIRPLYFVKEEDILAWKEYNGLRFLQCACRFTEQIAREQTARGLDGQSADIVHTSKRQEMKAVSYTHLDVYKRQSHLYAAVRYEFWHSHGPGTGKQLRDCGYGSLCDGGED